MDIQTYIDRYLQWLKSNFTFQKTGEYYEITAPFLDNSSDFIQFYVKQEGDDIYFTDDAYTINNLISHGLTWNRQKQQQVSTILRQFGVTLSGKELTMLAPALDFPRRKHMFMQAMMRVDDLLSNIKTRQTSIFTEDIASYFNKQNIYCTQNVQFSGKSGFSHNYDFLFQRTRNHPTLLCTAMNSPNKSSLGNVLFSWDDTRKERDDGSQLIVLMNDENRVQSGVESAFESYGVKTLRWSSKDASPIIKMLAS